MKETLSQVPTPSPSPTPITGLPGHFLSLTPRALKRFSKADPSLPSRDILGHTLAGDMGQKENTKSRLSFQSLNAQCRPPCLLAECLQPACTGQRPVSATRVSLGSKPAVQAGQALLLCVGLSLCTCQMERGQGDLPV